MILADTSLWIDHLRSGHPELAKLLANGAVLVHPFVIGELALGNLRDRGQIISLLHDLPAAVVADDAEVLRLIEQQALHGRGIGYADAHLLAATRLTPDAKLWTRDRRLAAVATDLEIGHDPTLP